MRPPDKEYGKSKVGVWWWGEAGSVASFVSQRSVNSSPHSPAPFKVDQTFLTASRMNE